LGSVPATGRRFFCSGVGVTTYELIRAKREGRELTPAELGAMVRGYLRGDVPDYQMSAFLMAVFFRGMTDAETVALTRLMLESGQTLDLRGIAGIKVDKHSTGGVGDKLSLIVAPIAAAAGVPVPMISGRGLGHTGGTLDKLESIPGMSTDLDPGRFTELVSEVGMAIVGQSPQMAPADRKMYALRDVTATIECRPLIVGSILSKKLAAGLDALVLDVKVGRGAFMKNVESARDLAAGLMSTAAHMGLPARALLTDMESPLGRCVGNALEVRESIEVLRGEGPPEVRELSLALAAQMLVLGGVAREAAEADEIARSTLDGGRALEMFARFVEAQGGDPKVVDRPEMLPRASVAVPVEAREDGNVAAIDALEIGLSAVLLGAGRATLEDELDPAVGIELLATVGKRVARGDAVALVHARDDDSVRAVSGRVERAFSYSDAPVEAPSRLLDTLTDSGGA